MELPKNKWCRLAVEQVRFKPDRDKIWDELEAHIEDRAESMKNLGYTAREAEERAVAAMGDPVKVGRQLNAVHKPWLGWLWIVSKVLVILFVIVFAYNALCTWTHTPLRLYGYQYTLWDHQAGLLREDGAEFPAEVTQLFYDEPGVSAPIGDFTLTVEKVTWNRPEAWTGYDYVIALVTVDGFLPWEDYMETRDFYVMDSLGNFYTPRYRQDSWDLISRSTNWELHFNICRRTATQWTYLLSFIPEENMEWFELRYDLEGHSVVLRIDMTGGEGL